MRVKRTLFLSSLFCMCFHEDEYGYWRWIKTETLKVIMKGFFLVCMCFLLPSFHLFQFLQRRSKVIVFFVSFFFSFFSFSFSVSLLPFMLTCLLYMNRCWFFCYLNMLILCSFHSCFLSCIIITIVLSVMYTHKRKTKERK